MRQRLIQLGCLLLVLMLFGCTSMFGRQGPPPDPLFANRKPIEARAKSGPPVAPPFSDPAPAVNPYYNDNGQGMGPNLRVE